MSFLDFAKYSNRIAVITNNGIQYSYQEISELQNELSKWMTKGSLVCLLAGNDLGGLVGYLSCLLNENVPIMLSDKISDENLDQIIEKYSPEYIWVSEEAWQGMSERCEDGFHEKKHFLGYILLYKRSPDKLSMNKELALLLPTSGSTGNFKLVRISKENIYSNTIAICKYMKLNENDRAVAYLPFSYTFGLSVVNTHLYVGGSIFITNEKCVRKRFWDNIDKFHITFFAGVPYTYECMKKLCIDRFSLHSLRLMVQAGGKLSEQLQKFWGEYANRTNKQFLIMYGQTEATARISYLPHNDCLKKLGSVGVPIPGCEILIVDEKKENVDKPGKSGEIVCKGNNVSMGYAHNREELSLKDQNNGILYTGDLGFLDDEGYLYIVGRKNRFAKIYGVRVDLSHIEELAKKSFLEEVVVVSNDNKIFLYTNAVVTKEKINALITKFPLNGNVFVIKEMGELPRNEYGKIKY